MNGYLYSDLSVGMTETFVHSFTDKDESMFRKITGDNNPMHYDDYFARIEAGFEKHISYGMLTASLLSTMAGVYLPGKYSLIHSIDSIKFKTPVYYSNNLYVVGSIIEMYDALQLICVNVKITNEEKRTVCTAKMKIKVLK